MLRNYLSFHCSHVLLPQPVAQLVIRLLLPQVPLLAAVPPSALLPHELEYGLLSFSGPAAVTGFTLNARTLDRQKIAVTINMPGFLNKPITFTCTTSNFPNQNIDPISIMLLLPVKSKDISLICCNPACLPGC